MCCILSFSKLVGQLIELNSQFHFHYLFFAKVFGSEKPIIFKICNESQNLDTHKRDLRYIAYLMNFRKINSTGQK